MRLKHRQTTGCLGEDKLLQLLSEFSCPINPDVERFRYSTNFLLVHQSISEYYFQECFHPNQDSIHHLNHYQIQYISL